MGRSSPVKIHFEQAGSGDPPLVFVPGWCCDHSLFQRQFDHFQSRHTVVSMDLRGCGKSDRPETGYDITTLAQDVFHVCRDLSLSRPLILGHSLGGNVAIEAAVQFPNLATAVIAVDPGPIDPLPSARKYYAELISDLGAIDGERARRDFIEGMLPEPRPEWQWIVNTMSSVPLGVAIEMLGGMMSWNGPDAMARCTVPLLVILAQAGGSNSPARLLEMKPDTFIGMTVGAGHFHQLEVPDQVNAMIRRFLEVAVRW